jgi:hypothetical protein
MKKAFSSRSLGYSGGLRLLPQLDATKRASRWSVSALVLMLGGVGCSGADPNGGGRGDPALWGTTSLPVTACVASGTEAAINAALVASNVAVLCPSAVFSLRNPVKFTAPNQQLYTQGLPTGSTRATLRITSASLSNAIDGNGQSGAIVKNIQVDGNRPNLGYDSAHPDALVEMGGAALNQKVMNIVAKNTRGWSTIHFFEGTVTNDIPQCQNATITNNTIGPAGEPDGTWADGISLACGHSLVQGNTITDATDGAIVIFGAPGSIIKQNTIVASTKQLLGGINMVDYGPANGINSWHGNYTGTQVTGNLIDGRGAFIKVGVAIGSSIWFCPEDPQNGTNRGGSVTNNTLQGQNIGYGYAVNGVSGFTVTGNTDTSRHVGVPAQECASGGMPAQPASYQYQTVTSTTLQPEFRSATLTGVLGLTEPEILRVATAPTSCTFMNGNQGLYPNQSLSSCDGRLRLTLQGNGNLVLYQGGTVLWASDTVGRPSAVAIMQLDGNFVIYDSTGVAIWSSGTEDHPGARLSVQNDGNTVIYDSSGHPIWATDTCCR